jgi:hypothetical protein
VGPRITIFLFLLHAGLHTEKRGQNNRRSHGAKKLHGHSCSHMFTLLTCRASADDRRRTTTTTPLPNDTLVLTFKIKIPCISRRARSIDRLRSTWQAPILYALSIGVLEGFALFFLLPPCSPKGLRNLDETMPRVSERFVAQCSSSRKSS